MNASSRNQTANTLFMQALGFVQAGLFYPAEQTLLKVIELYESEQESQAAAFACLTLARVYADQAKYTEAHAILQRVLHEAETRGDQETLVRALYETGALAERMHDTDAAHAAYIRVLRTAPNAGDRATAALRLGALANATNRPDDAAHFYRTAFELFQSIEHDLGMAQAAYELTRLLANVNPTEARRYYEIAHTLAETWGDETLLHALQAIPLE